MQSRNDAGFTGQTIIVTGSASGIGEVTAAALLARGANVVAVDRDAERLNAALKEAPEARLERVIADVATESGNATMIERCQERFGGLDGLVANAAVGRQGAADELAPAAWDAVIDAGLRSVYLAAHFGIPVMRRGGGGSFVAVASQLGFVGDRQNVAYCAAKGGVINLVRAMALDYALDDIRVNSVCPGPVETPMLRRSLEVRCDAGAAREALEQRVPQGRIAMPEEIAEVVMFLLSRRASFVTGAAWVVDGGYLAGNHSNSMRETYPI